MPLTSATLADMHEGIGLLGWTGPLEGPGGARREAWTTQDTAFAPAMRLRLSRRTKNFLQCSSSGGKMSGEPARIGESRLEDGMLHIPWLEQPLLERADVI